MQTHTETRVDAERAGQMGRARGDGFPGSADSLWWNVVGPFGYRVGEQARAQDVPDEVGAFDVYDVTDPHKPDKLTSLVAAVSVFTALFVVANFGVAGHTYRVISRRTLDGTRPVRSFLIQL